MERIGAGVFDTEFGFLGDFCLLGGGLQEPGTPPCHRTASDGGACVNAIDVEWSVFIALEKDRWEITLPLSWTKGSVAPCHAALIPRRQSMNAAIRQEQLNTHCSINHTDSWGMWLIFLSCHSSEHDLGVSQVAVKRLSWQAECKVFSARSELICEGNTDYLVKYHISIGRNNLWSWAIKLTRKRSFLPSHAETTTQSCHLSLPQGYLSARKTIPSNNKTSKLLFVIDITQKPLHLISATQLSSQIRDQGSEHRPFFPRLEPNPMF